MAKRKNDNLSMGEALGEFLRVALHQFDAAPFQHLPERRRQQRRIGQVLDAVLEHEAGHDDLVGGDDGRQAVRDDDRRAAALDRLQRVENFGLGPAEPFGHVGTY